MTAPVHVRHASDGPLIHDGPGHRDADPGWCGGCWWERIGQYQSASEHLVRHADDCPACAAEGVPG